MIFIVSGLPRSGTSLMMQMLEAGGLPTLTDSIREPDESNPKGYYEFEKVKILSTDTEWLTQAENKAIKVVSLLLYNLPADHQYKIIFMERDMDEILASQKEMLKHRDEETGPPDVDMHSFFESHLIKLREWLKTRKNMDIFYCNYNEIIKKPAETASRITGFLSPANLDPDKMISVIDKSLYRHNKA